MVAHFASRLQAAARLPWFAGVMLRPMFVPCPRGLLAPRQSNYLVLPAPFPLIFLLAACSSDPTPAPADAAVEVAGDVAEAPTGDAAVIGITGTVRDKAGEPVAGATIEIAGSKGFSDALGKYTVAAPAGPASVGVTANWFLPFTGNVTVAATGLTSYDIALNEMPLKVEPADQTLATEYNKTFDWSKQTVSIGLVAAPTRRHFDTAVYLRNPALYRDVKQQPPLMPTPQPAIGAAGPTNFTFPTAGNAAQAIDPASVIDKPSDAQAAVFARDFLTFRPAVNWLAEADAAKAGGLKAVGAAIRAQAWGGNAVRPQDIERLYIDAAGALWIEVVFEPFVVLGAGISDDDGDGRKEVYAKIDPAHYTAEIVMQLATDYARRTYTTHAFSKAVTKSLSELYSLTFPTVERYIGQPIELPGVGTIMYPFVVLKHAAGQRNVILVAPPAP